MKHYEAQLSKEKATYAGLNETQRKRAEETLLEGDLLEVTTDETTQLWQVILLLFDRFCPVITLDHMNSSFLGLALSKTQNVCKERFSLRLVCIIM